MDTQKSMQGDRTLWSSGQQFLLQTTRSEHANIKTALVSKLQTLRMRVASNVSRSLFLPLGVSVSVSSLRKIVFISVTWSLTCSYCFCTRPNREERSCSYYKYQITELPFHVLASCQCTTSSLLDTLTH